MDGVEQFYDPVESHQERACHAIGRGAPRSTSESMVASDQFHVAESPPVQATNLGGGRESLARSRPIER